MTQKEKNTEIARLLLSHGFWRPEYFPRYYTEGFTMELPSAPPGLPAYFSVWESERCFEWLNRTVMDWNVTLEEFYPTPDPDCFWGIGVCRGTVIWGKEPGTFQSKFFARMEFRDGKVHFIKGWLDALAFLRAAHIEIPKIIKDLDNPRIDEFLRHMPKRFQGKPTASREDADAGVDMSSEAIERRLAANLKQNICGIQREKYRKEESFSPDFKRGAWFIPDYIPWLPYPEEEMSLHNNNEQESKAPKELASRIFAWVKISSPWMYRDTRGKNYPTDDPSVYFSEMYSNGPCCWLGNGFEQGHYHEQFLMVMKFDEAGRELIRDEVICPQYKYASANISLPSFPYYA